MTNRAFFTLLLRLVGLVLLVAGLGGLSSALMYYFVYKHSLASLASEAIAPLLHILFGAHFLFSAKWLIRLCTRKLDGHCERCGYPVAQVKADTCPECNWPIPPRPALISDPAPAPAPKDPA